MNTKHNRIIFLDYLRVFAFISVLVGHKMYAEVSGFINLLPSYHITQQALISFISQLFYGGGAGVVVFFMISGYIILHVLSFEKPFEFFIKRFFRIYPLLIFAVLLEAYLWFQVTGQPFNLKNILIQSSLLGDFFNTPYALQGVEWTLRVEIIFYLLMLIINSLNIMHKGHLLISLFVIITLILDYFSPFPTQLFIGYFTIYFPILFLGSAIYLYENKKINLIVLLFFFIFTFHHYFTMILSYQPASLSSNFAIVGCIVFVFFWLIRAKLETFVLNKAVLLLSALTYSIYLFHNFLWFFISHYMGTDNKLLILLYLILFCIIVYNIIEKPMNMIGKKKFKQFYKVKQTDNDKK